MCPYLLGHPYSLVQFIRRITIPRYSLFSTSRFALKFKINSCYIFITNGYQALRDSRGVSNCYILYIYMNCYIYNGLLPRPPRDSRGVSRLNEWATFYDPTKASASIRCAGTVYTYMYIYTYMYYGTVRYKYITYIYILRSGICLLYTHMYFPNYCIHKILYTPINTDTNICV